MFGWRSKRGWLQIKLRDQDVPCIHATMYSRTCLYMEPFSQKYLKKNTFAELKKVGDEFPQMQFLMSIGSISLPEKSTIITL